MATWMFEPGHTEAEFRARHMMVTWVRGLFKDIHGQIELDWDRCLDATFEGEIDATGIWTGEPARDAHLRSADFFEVEVEGSGTDPAGNDRISLTGRGEIDRTDFGIAFDSRLDSGALVVGEKVRLVLTVEAVREA